MSMPRTNHSRRHQRFNFAVLFAKLTTATIIITLLAACASQPLTREERQSFGRFAFRDFVQMSGEKYRQDKNLNKYVNKVGQKLIAKTSLVDSEFDFVILNNLDPFVSGFVGNKVAISTGMLLLLNNEAELAAALSSAIGGVSTEFQEIHVFVMYDRMVGNERGESLENAFNESNALRRIKGDANAITLMADAGYPAKSYLSFLKKTRKAEENEFLQNYYQLRENEVEYKALNTKSGNTRNPKTYRSKLAKLKQQKKYYVSLDKAYDLTDDEKYAAALKRVNRLIRQQPKEALHHGLRGRIRFEQGRYEDAITNLDRAIDLNPHFYAFFLLRGAAHNKLEDREAAREDWQIAFRLNPVYEEQLRRKYD